MRSRQDGLVMTDRDGAARACLQPHPRDEHYGHSAADGRDQGIVKVGKNSSRRYDRLPALAAELVSRQVAVLFALNDPSAKVAKAATATMRS
jgi:hypothetical protein